MQRIPFRAFTFRWLWCAVALIGGVDAIWLALSDHLSVDLVSTMGNGGALASFSGLAIYCRTRPHAEFRLVERAASGLLFVAAAFIVLRVLDHLVMSLPFAMADDMLAHADDALGLTWMTYARWVAARPAIIEIFSLSYTNLTGLTFIVLLGLYCFRRVDRADEYIRLFFMCALGSILIGMCVPAMGAVAHFATPDMIAAFGSGAGTYQVAPIEALRSGAPHVLDLNDLPGLIAFPSFHTASGILIAYACRGIRFAAPASVAYAAVMIASTPIMGGHYFVDLIGGAAMTLAVVLVDRVFARRRSEEVPRVFGPGTTAYS